MIYSNNKRLCDIIMISDHYDVITDDTFMHVA